jgi:plastocyanin
MNVNLTVIGSGFAAVMSLAVAGCGNEGAAPAVSTTTTATPAPTAAPAATKTATSVPAATRPASLDGVKASQDSGAIVGWVGYQGPPPKRRPISFGGEKACADLNKDGAPHDESLELNPNNTVKWAVVSIRGKVPGDYPVPDKPVVLDQVGCVFTPHVAALMVGQEIDYRNSDPVTHNIRVSATKNTASNLVFAPNQGSKAKFEAAENGIQLKCDIHFWMSSYVHVFPHPFFAVTGDDGSFVIQGVPPGKYTVQVWQETFKPQTQTVEVKAGEVNEVPFTLSKG